MNPIISSEILLQLLWVISKNNLYHSKNHHRVYRFWSKNMARKSFGIWKKMDKSFNTGEFGYHPPSSSFFQSLPLKYAGCLRPSFLGNPLHLGFLWPSYPAPSPPPSKNHIFQWTQKILNIFIQTLCFKTN